MILAIDIGNTNIVIGCIENEATWCIERISTDHQKTALEYAILIRTILDIHQVDADAIEGSILSSVVPSLSFVLKEAIGKLLPDKRFLTVGPGIKTGLKIGIDNPAQLGADLVVAAVAALHEYPGALILADMGTATTISVIDSKHVFRGGAIIPGLRVSMQSLVSNTSQLPSISLTAPKHAIGTNTIDCMRSGAIYGNADLLDGMFTRMEKELGEPVTIIATGGLAQYVLPLCTHEIVYDDGLLLKGLKILYDKNTPA